MPRTAGCARTCDRRSVTAAAVAVGALLFAIPSCVSEPAGVATDAPEPVDPAAWGTDHVGERLPEYVTGDECLFCHRHDIGPDWATDRHQQTVRRAGADAPSMVALRGSAALGDSAEQVDLVLGRYRRVRFLKRAGYGRLSVLSTSWVPGGDREGGELHAATEPHWDDDLFGESCAGCHTTGVDSATRQFAAVSLDCYVCHGEATLDHSNDTSKMMLSAKRADPPRVVVSICGQCHVRTGRSRSTGLPYPNNFMAGDNLFRDFEVALSDSALERVSVADRHILENIRDVVARGQTEVTCLSCHEVHRQRSRKHRRLPETDLCRTCHEPDERRPTASLEFHNETCGY